MYFPKLSKISLMIINEGRKFQVCFHPSEIIDGCCARKKKTVLFEDLFPGRLSMYIYSHIGNVN